MKTRRKYNLKKSKKTRRRNIKKKRTRRNKRGGSGTGIAIAGGVSAGILALELLSVYLKRRNKKQKIRKDAVQANKRETVVYDDSNIYEDDDYEDFSLGQADHQDERIERLQEMEKESQQRIQQRVNAEYAKRKEEEKRDRDERLLRGRT